MDAITGGQKQTIPQGMPSLPSGNAVPDQADKLLLSDGSSAARISQKAVRELFANGNNGTAAAEVNTMSALGFGKSGKELPRHMSEWEKQSFRMDFPKLDVEKALVTDESTMEYNCISWTVGETHQWFWPPEMFPEVSEEEAFDRFYAEYGLKPAPAGEVARWRNDQGITHGCISGPDHGPAWESKCGADLRIQHDLNELEGEIYGHVDGFYARTGGAQIMAAYRRLDVPMEVLSYAMEKSKAIDPQVKEKFDGHYARWSEFRQDPEVRFSANPTDYCRTEAFREIIKMGADVIPLLMEKMSKGDHFCLRAVREIKKRSQGPVSLMMLPTLSQKENANDSEQNKAALALMRWYEESR